MITDPLSRPTAARVSNSDRRVVAGVLALCVLSGLGGWALAERSAQAQDASVTGTIIALSGNETKVCVAVAAENHCGILVVPPGTATPTMGQQVQVFLRYVNGAEFLILPPAFG